MAKIGATFGLAFALGLLFVSFEIVSSGPGAISKREANAVEDWYEETKNTIIGGTCITNDQCSVVSYCDHDNLKLTCKLKWWFILVLAAVAFLILSSIISCLCCPCCCLYNLCKSACDCLFCCCKSSKGSYRRPWNPVTQETQKYIWEREEKWSFHQKFPCVIKGLDRNKKY